MTRKEVEVIIELAKALLEAVEAAPAPFGAPGGILYAGVMGFPGMTLGTFQAMMDGLVSAGKIYKAGDCYFPRA